MTNPINNTNFLRTSRNFPKEINQLTVEIDKSYVDIANVVNNRTIGTFPISKPAITGESWFINDSNGQSIGKQQTLRQVYQFTAAGNISHGINFSNIVGFTAIYGTFTDGSSWYPLPYVDTTNVGNQVSVSVSSTNIVITAGGTSPPSITSGLIVLEWLSNA